MNRKHLQSENASSRRRGLLLSGSWRARLGAGLAGALVMLATALVQTGMLPLGSEAGIMPSSSAMAGAASPRDAKADRVSGRAADASNGIGWIPRADLPTQALLVIELIRKGGPFPYDKDGTVFQNREKRLPTRPRGVYTEYTVATPGARTRGARRIVVAGSPSESDEFYYTDDHYDSFRRIRDP